MLRTSRTKEVTTLEMLHSIQLDLYSFSKLRQAIFVICLDLILRKMAFDALAEKLNQLTALT